jgi:hypothetical protein
MTSVEAKKYDDRRDRIVQIMVALGRYKPTLAD